MHIIDAVECKLVWMMYEKSEGVKKNDILLKSWWLCEAIFSVWRGADLLANENNKMSDKVVE